MTKKPYKVMALSAIMAVVAAGNILPAHTYAAESTTKPIPIHASVSDASDKYSEYSLGPDGLRDAMARTGSNALVMDLYALTIIKQANVNFNGITTVDDSLKTKVVHHQDVARGNANHWLDTIKPQLISTNQNIINYNTKFQNYYDTLVTAVDNKDKATLTKGLTRLSASITENKEKVDKLVADLKQFRNKMTTDTQNFKGDANQLTSILASQDAGIPLMQNQITTYNEAIGKYNAIIIGSSVATALGPIAIIGGAVVIATGAGTPLGIGLIAGGAAAIGGGTAGIVLAKKELDNAQAEIQKITGQISQAQLQVAGLTNIKTQTEYLTNTIDVAITALQNISNQWYTMGSKYNSLLQNVESISPNDLVFIKEDLNIAKDSWKNIKDYAEKIYAEDIKVVDTKA
ncbi:enterotoxin [Bacillus pseudomycoides]|uniref:non-hemolytic enterotoxin subunit B n=1 Tax=Bacillus TaxID=1386 RepID=UPI0001A14E00|nr:MULTISPECIES: HBL/NHE enterotoxin family protein [Bacillus]EEM17460.1 Hemolytic enterotoxin [Bacillus pseudomycoides DSM 12442]MBJ8028523.1 alpha-helical pore-forming toxin family protein [Bacillus cereus group sp. N21]MED1596176.1 HBL/NHE enterotoxin family protein [Bacillus pseudomycoides]MED4650177.1 HBL/NHE enterotoxin family protein [Bacillus pseudomycoides]MED4709974.1 HBL/NHE enterotoxin family protein [Bacillus pseudomycoides]